MKLFHATLLALSTLILPYAAYAAPICPTLTGASAAYYTTAATVAGSSQCNTLINVNATNTLSFTAVNLNPYDGNDDNYVGVTNNSGHTISSLVLTGSGIFGFDGDGIDAFGIAGNAADIGKYGAYAYGGTDAYFTNIVGNTGTVNFIGGIAAGATGYFSLEGPPATGNGIGGSVGPSATPEPSSLILLGTGALSLAGAVRRRMKA